MTKDIPWETGLFEADNEYDDSTSLARQTDTLPDGRTLRSELWGESGYTFLTYRFSKDGLADKSKGAILDYLGTQGIKIDPVKFPEAKISMLDDFEDPDTVSLTLTIGESDE